MNHTEFLSDRFGGKNWVLARRTANIVRQYGEDVICISRQRYAAVEKEYRALFGDPYDKTRAQLYCALREAVRLLERSNMADRQKQFIDWAHATLEKERNAP